MARVTRASKRSPRSPACPSAACSGDCARSATATPSWSSRPAIWPPGSCCGTATSRSPRSLSTWATPTPPTSTAPSGAGPASRPGSSAASSSSPEPGASAGLPEISGWPAMARGRHSGRARDAAGLGITGRGGDAGNSLRLRPAGGTSSPKEHRRRAGGGSLMRMVKAQRGENSRFDIILKLH